MKTRYLLLALLMNMAYATSAYTTLTLRDPRGWWSGQGRIDSALLSVKPKGAFFECGLYLTFNWGQFVHSDTAEVQYYFDLPAGAFITDSWLWVGNQIVQADLLDRERAHTIYEGIVQRRQDPSILYKNGATQYELRIFPLPPHQKRKVKITYMVPATWANGRANIPVPVELLRPSVSSPVLEVLAYTDNEWQQPSIQNTPQPVALQPVSGQPYSHALVPAAYINTFDIAISYKQPLNTGIYASFYETSPGEGYYQLVADAGRLFNIQTKRKVAIAIDHETDKANTTKAAILAQARQLLHTYYNPTDSFNLFLSNFSVYQHANAWLPCDSQTIEQVFNSINTNMLSNYSNLPPLLNSAINFIKTTNATASILLMSSSCTFASVPSANQLSADVMGMMSPQTYPIHILNYADKNLPYVWSQSSPFWGNSYLYSLLTGNTGGELVEMGGQNYYPYYNYTLAQATNLLLGRLQPKITFPEITTTLQSGFCHSKFSSFAPGQSLPVNTSLIQVGKFSGNTPVTVQVTGLYQMQPVVQTQQLTPYTGDTMIQKMWASYYMDALQFSNTLSNQQKIEVMDTSKNNRVLSRFTAFLALEPSDTVTACADCEDETNWGGVSIQQQEADSVQLKAWPNPFHHLLQLELTTPGADQTIQVRILDVSGRTVLTTEVECHQGTAQWQWAGTDQHGNMVTTGVYFIECKTEAFAKTMRVVKY